jgi:hypothetical protein
MFHEEIQVPPQGTPAETMRKIALGLRTSLLLCALITLAGDQAAQTIGGFSIGIDLSDGSAGICSSFPTPKGCGDLKAALAFGVIAFINALAIAVLGGYDFVKAGRDFTRATPNDALLAKMSLPLSFLFMLVFALVSSSVVGDAVKEGASYGSGFAFAIIGWMAAFAHFVVSMKVAGRDPFSAEAFAPTPIPSFFGSSGGNSSAGLVQPDQQSPYTGAPPNNGARAFVPPTAAPPFVPPTAAPPQLPSTPAAAPTFAVAPGSFDRVRMDTFLAANQRKSDAGALVGERVRVFDGEAGERVGTVVGTKSTFGGSTTHDIQFEDTGATEAKLLQKSKGASKGLRFHVLEQLGAE